MSILSFLSRKAVSMVAVAALVGGGVLVAGSTSASADPLPAAAAPTGPAPIAQRTSSTATADELPTVQIDNGVVWTQTIVGNTVYVGGSFSNARPAGAAAGTNLIPRSNLLAYNLSTGVLLTTWAPSVNGTVKSVVASPDGKTIYVGGSFSTANGTARFNLAAFDATTGALITGFKASAGGSYVQAIAATSTTVYVGGLLSAGNGVTRKNLAAFSVGTGALLAWAPTTDQQVDTMVLTPGNTKLIIGGRFGSVNGATQRGMAAMSLTDGSVLPWTAPTVIQDGLGSGSTAGKAGIWSLSTDGVSIFGTGWVFSDVNTGNLEGAFSADPATGNINWIEDCHGDHYGAYSDTVNVYVIGHPHDCTGVGAYPNATPAPGNMRHALAFTAAATGVLAHTQNTSIYKDWGGSPSPTMIGWYPDFVTGQFTGQGQAAWTITGSGNYVVAGGEFPYVNGQPQYGLVRFARPGTAPSKEGPRLSGSKWTPSLSSFQSGQVRLSIPLNWDRDDLTLHYQIYRSGTAAPVYDNSIMSFFWNLPPLSFTDKGLTPGSTYTYKVVATDPDGNTVSSASVPVTVTSTPTSPYAQQVIADGASTYWRLGEATGSATAFDWAGQNDAAVGTTVTQTSSGAIVNDPNSASTFDGTSNSTVAGQTLAQAPDTFTTQAWFRTTTTNGGKILGYGNVATGTGNSSSYDRQIYMSNDGTIHFGVYTGATVTIGTAKPYNDGQWHQVVSEMSPAGMALYVDGILIGTNSPTAGQSYAGYWRVGGDNLNGWPYQPSSNYFAGDIDDVSIYATALTKAQIRNQYTIAGYTVAVPAAPTDAYGAAVYKSDPDSYWRLDDAAGTTAVADSGQNVAPATASGPVGFGQVGALQSGVNQAAQFGNQAIVVGQKAITNPTVYSAAAWFKTTTGTGGKIIGFGNATTGTSSHYDRHVYMQDNGQLVFGTYTGQLNTITTPKSYNDGQWHQVVADQGPNGMELWIDGTLIGTNSQTGAEYYTGYWRIGGDSTWGSSSPWFAGVIDEAAVYSRVLTPSEISNQYSLGAGVQAPTASFVTSKTNLTLSVDASATTAGNGRTIAGYAWNFGDGATGSGQTTTHSYAAAGTYTVTLTATDNQGLVGTSTASVTVTAPHTAPVAAITSTPTGLSVAFDGTGSTTSDGATITSYAWDFGDGATSSSATPTHAFAAAGTYPVKLTVVDSLGATSAQVTSATTVSHAAPSAAFTSSVNQSAVSVDASTSTASDGATLSYDWNWGDGSSHGTTVTATHTYAAPAGPQTITLTVTDSLQATGTVSHTVTTVAHSAPVAVISSSAPAGLTVAFDGSNSTASDGATIASYAWNFGDGTSSTLAKPSHTFPATGSYAVTLTVVDSQNSTSAPAGTSIAVSHAAPVAKFTGSANQLLVSVDASATTSSDSATLSYDWNWGDGTAHGVGPTATHSFAAAGAQSIVLTVTDSYGATGSVTNSVTTTSSTVVAADTFTRTVATGWGSADTGGAWSGTTNFSTNGTVGKLALTRAGQTSTSYLASASALNVNATLDVAWDKLADGAGEQLNYVVRHTAGGEYRLKLRVSSTGVITVSIAKLVGTTETLLSNKVLPGITYVAGQALRMRFSVSGSGTTTLNAKVWRTTDVEPTAWFLTSTDSDAALQATGQIGINVYQASTVTTLPVTATFDNLQAIKS